MAMRRTQYQAARTDALALFERAPVIHLATLDDEGRPIHRTLHGVVFGDGVVWHGAPKGEKSTVGGRRGVASCENIVATIPSYFLDPERACPATTYYESAQAAGTIEKMVDPREKAQALQCLMRRYQPEGGYKPIAADDPMYRAVVKNLALWRLPFTELVAKIKLGQNRTPAEMKRILEQLWRRGAAGDVAAIGRLLQANPEAGRPDFLEVAAGVRLTAWLDESDVSDALGLLRETYWNRTVDDSAIARAQVSSSAWVGAKDEDGAVVATARAVSDGAKHAWVYDVAVAKAHQGRGVGSAVMGLLLDHPAVRGAGRVHLQTLDAQKFYRTFGFEEVETSGPTPGSRFMSRLCVAEAPCTPDGDVEEWRHPSGSPRSAR